MAADQSERPGHGARLEELPSAQVWKAGQNPKPYASNLEWPENLPPNVSMEPGKCPAQPPQICKMPRLMSRKSINIGFRQFRSNYHFRLRTQSTVFC